MVIKEIEVRDIITKTNLPVSNPPASSLRSSLASRT